MFNGIVMAQLIDKSALVAEIERRKNQFMSQADNFHSLGMEEKRDHFAVLASNMRSILSFLDTLKVKEVGTETLTERQRLEVMIVATISGLEATYEHYKNKYPVSSHGSVVCSSIPAVKHLVETYLIELNKEIQIENLKEEIKKL